MPKRSRLAEAVASERIFVLTAYQHFLSHSGSPESFASALLGSEKTTALFLHNCM